MKRPSYTTWKRAEAELTERHAAEYAAAPDRSARHRLMQQHTTERKALRVIRPPSLQEISDQEALAALRYKQSGRTRRKR